MIFMYKIIVEKNTDSENWQEYWSIMEIKIKLPNRISLRLS